MAELAYSIRCHRCQAELPRDADGRITSCPKCSRVHLHLLSVVPRLPTDYSAHGGKVERWSDPTLAYEDCSCGCRWALWLEDTPDELLSMDWLVCTKPGAPRCGLLTFEHQAGSGCFEAEEDDGS